METEDPSDKVLMRCRVYEWMVELIDVLRCGAALGHKTLFAAALVTPQTVLAHWVQCAFYT